MTEETLLPFPGPRARIAPATQFRSTWVVSSVQSLREHGHFERYVALLPSSLREPIVSAIAGVWLPMPTVRAHYDACDQLHLGTDAQILMGRAVGERVKGSLLSTAVRAAKGAGITPWIVLPQFHRLWMRGADGGAAAVFRLGPKEARAEFVGCELFDVGYFRHAFRGVLVALTSLFCETAFVHELAHRSPSECAYRIQWA